MGVPSTGLSKVCVAGVTLSLLFSGCASLRGARLYQRGTEALERGDLSAAISDLERAAVLVPHASEIQNHLGVAYTEAGRHDAAFASYRTAVALDCGNSAAQHNLRVAQALERTRSAKPARARAGASEGEGQ